MEKTSNTKDNILGTLPIHTLLAKFAIPSVIAFIVNSLYNVVDQIFIGQGVGYLGNAATTVFFPFVTIGVGVCQLFSQGSVASVSQNLGKGDRERAERTMGNGICLCAVFGILLFVFGNIFIEPLLWLFGATENILPYAKSYGKITIIGIPFTIIAISINDMIRTDGKPRKAMLLNLSGTILNTILDPVFIFVFHWGVAGAAIATVISQVLVFVISLTQIRLFQTITFRLRNLVLQFSCVCQICALGFSIFIQSVAMLVVQVFINKAAVKYGGLSKYGSDIPITCFGIVMKVLQIIFAVIMGTTFATMPIFGFNYGAGLYNRLKQLIKLTLLVTLAIGVIGTAALQIFPLQVISLFGQEDDLYNEFAVISMRRMTWTIFILPLQFLMATYFQTAGNPKWAVFLTLARSVFCFLPLLFILPQFFGVFGIMYSYPCSDVIVCSLSAFLLVREWRKLSRLQESI